MVNLQELKKKMPSICRKYGIEYVDVFGSVARGDQVETSDLDLIIEFSEPRRDGISRRFFGFLHEIEDDFCCKVDLLTERSIRNERLKQGINQDRMRLYG